MPTESVENHGERLARVEARLDQLVLMAGRAQSDLREHLAWQRRLHEQHAERLGKLERDAERVRTHLSWMKAVFTATQATIIAWFGRK